jgi:aminoglycoside/choline kinase family phosphotransferase
LTFSGDSLAVEQRPLAIRAAENSKLCRAQMIESVHVEGNEIAMNRLDALRDWARAQLQGADIELTPASADASFRRYFRLTSARGSWIAMDAPPEKEDCAPFLHVAGVLRRAAVNVPEILAQDLSRGFLLLTDFGSVTYLDALRTQPFRPLYDDAAASLIAIQRASSPGELPEYGRSLLEREIDLFPQWYAARHLGRKLDARQSSAFALVRNLLIERNLNEPRVYVHRDYHSRNLMFTQPNPGILDFQDAVFGPLSYDLVSLLKDAYIEWPEEQVLDMAVRYWEKARRVGLPVRADFADFYVDFEWMGLQRHLKVLGIFARLCYRDGKSAYLADLPLVLRHVHRAARRYRELAPLADLIEELHGHGRSAAYGF